MLSIDVSPQTEHADPSAGTSIFPLPFSPFEFYFLVDERPDYPSVFPIKLEWTGTLDRSALELAYQQAHARHPLLSARIAYDRTNWPQWVAGEPAPISWCGPNSPGAEPFSIHSFGAVRLYVSSHGGRTVMDFVFHHAAVDGLGAFQFLKDFLIAYE